MGKVDRRAVPRVAYPVAAIIGVHEPYTSLIVAGERNAIGAL